MIPNRPRNNWTLSLGSSRPDLRRERKAGPSGQVGKFEAWAAGRKLVSGLLLGKEGLGLVVALRCAALRCTALGVGLSRNAGRAQWESKAALI